jgi:hypothetical protein
MDVNCIGHNGYVVFRLPRPVETPPGWVIREAEGVIGGQYRIAERSSGSRRLYCYLPWVPVRETREEAERDRHPWTGQGNYAYGAVVEFPLGGYVWYQTGLENRPKAEERARRAMAEVRAALGLSD